jgi:hypothetical protein
MLMIFELEALRPWLAIGAFLLIVFSLMAAAPLALATGVVFAVASVYFGRSTLLVAVLISVVVSLVAALWGFFMMLADSSALQGLRQIVSFSALLSVPAAIAATICWLATRSLHGANFGEPAR